MNDHEAPADDAGYGSTPNLRIQAADGVQYAYRDLGPRQARALVLLQHFRGNLDNWDPALIDALARHRRVITVDYQGVGGSSGTTADTIERMADEILAFTTALDLDSFDLLGFSIGSMVAQRVALTRPTAIGKLVLASTAPQGAAGMHGWAPQVIGAIGTPRTTPEQYLGVFFADSETSQSAGKQALGRMYARTRDRDTDTTWATRLAQYDAVAKWGVPNHARLQEVAALTMPVFVANGSHDPMILPRYSHLIAGLLPNATIKVYPDSAHGFLFQHHEQFAADVLAFLDTD